MGSIICSQSGRLGRFSWVLLFLPANIGHYAETAVTERQIEKYTRMYQKIFAMFIF
jgi:hypothetical protein